MLRWASMKAIAILFTLACGVGICGQIFDVKIVARQDKDTSYSYVVPGWVNSSTNSTTNCSDSAVGVSCSGTATTSGTSMPARSGVLQVSGATLTLQLPDGRVAVVNCNSKYQIISGPAHHRSCRVPFRDEDIRLELNGNSAKLRWLPNHDGTKWESETYTLLGVH